MYCNSIYLFFHLNYVFVFCDMLWGFLFLDWKNIQEILFMKNNLSWMYFFSFLFSFYVLPNETFQKNNYKANLFCVLSFAMFLSVLYNDMQCLLSCYEYILWIIFFLLLHELLYFIFISIYLQLFKILHHSFYSYVRQFSEIWLFLYFFIINEALCLVFII